jgi:uncharacterized repeat protein (TIGR01451 family)
MQIHFQLARFGPGVKVLPRTWRVTLIFNLNQGKSDMTATSNPSKTQRRRGAGSVLLALLALCLLILGSAAYAAPPAAGTSIGNQASATYTDGSGTSRTVTSNTVQTVVQQVASLTLTSNGNKSAAVGSTVYYPHTLINTGNGTDTFALTSVSAAGGNFTPSTITIYPDANGTGVPSGPAITSSGALAAGATFQFIVAVTVPGTATSGQTNAQTVTATSGFNTAQKAIDTDTSTVTANAVISLTKAVSASSGAPGSGPYTYTLTYTNTGNSTATNVVVTDTIPAGLTYQSNSGLWSVTGSTQLTNAKATYGTAPNTLVYDYAVTTATTVIATLAQVQPGQSGTISFTVKVNTGQAPGVINNTASLSYNDGSGSAVSGTSNTTPFSVTQNAAVTITSTPVASANPGSTVTFTNVVTNTGTGVDTFNISLASSNSFPAGTSFVLYKSDGVTPLVDTNNDGIPDTGPLAVNATYNVVVKAILPSSITGTGPYAVNKTATSTVNPSVSATVADTLTTVTTATVDLTNNAALGKPGVLGSGPGPEGAAVVTNTLNPGSSTTFVLVTNNTSSIADSYNLAAGSTTGFTGLPTGWSVTFKADGGAGNCSTTGATITNTGTVNAGGYATVCAILSIPASGTSVIAGTTAMYFRAQSPATGGTDVIHDAATVNAVRSLTFTPNDTGQVYPGGSVVYSHTLTNTGNVTEGNGSASTVGFGSANTQSGWTTVEYYDANNNGVLDSTDPVISGNLNAVLAGGLAPGQSITIFDKVLAPSSATLGQVNTTSVTLTTTNGSNPGTSPATVVATDGTTVISGNVTLVKQQALDAACTGTPSGAYSTATITTGAIPGACIVYQITVQNAGSANATGVTVSDSTPAFTTVSTAAVTTVGTVTGPAVGSTGSITATIGTLTPGQSAVVTFGAKISQ